MGSYKIARILSVVPYRDRFARLFQEKKLSDGSYEEALQALRQEWFLYPSSFTAEFHGRGHEAIDLLGDLPELQVLWAREQGVGSLSGEALVLEQLRRFQPDVVYFERLGGFGVLSPSITASLKEIIPSVRMVTGMMGTAGFDPSYFEQIDLLFCMDQQFVSEFKTRGIKAVLCHHLFDGPFMKEAERTEPFVFVGTSGFQSMDHRSRYELLGQLVECSPLRLWCYEFGPPSLKQTVRAQLIHHLHRLPSGVLSLLAQKTRGRLARFSQEALRIQSTGYSTNWFVDKKPLQEMFPGRCSPAVFGSDYFSLLARSQVVLNMHTDFAGHYGNMRTFEVTGMGATLLTDRAEEGRLLFEPDYEVISYRSKEECLEKVRYLMDHPSKSREIGEAARRRVLREHLFCHRADILDTEIQKFLSEVPPKPGRLDSSFSCVCSDKI